MICKACREAADMDRDHTDCEALQRNASSRCDCQHGAEGGGVDSAFLAGK